jgi:hypothetical protein
LVDNRRILGAHPPVDVYIQEPGVAVNEGHRVMRAAAGHQQLSMGAPLDDPALITRIKSASPIVESRSVSNEQAQGVDSIGACC